MKNYPEANFKTGKRDRLEIVAAIIAAAYQPSTFTRLMSQANLSYSLLKEYLTFMIGKGLVAEQDTARGTKKTVFVYQATKKGNKFLELYCENLVLLHGERFLDGNKDLAEAYLLQYCRKNKLILGSKLRQSLDTRIEKASKT